MTTPLHVAPDPLAGCAPLPRWLLQRIDAGEEALALVDPARDFDALCTAWMSAEQPAAAIRLIAGVLPARECIWWGWVSARHAVGLPGAPAPSAAVHAALTAVEQWIVRPDDNARRTAWQAGNDAGLDTPIGLTAAAVFMSGVTVGPAHLPAVPPPPGGAQPLVAGAVLLAATAGGPEQFPSVITAFAAQGLEIVKRIGGWDQALQVAHETFKRQEQEHARATAPAAGAR